MISQLPRRPPTIPKRDVKLQAGHNVSLKEMLDRLYLENNTNEFIPKDPVQFPHMYKNKKDREIAAFLAATIAWGRRDLILKSAKKMFALMGKSPYDFVMKGDFPKTPGPKTPGLKTVSQSGGAKPRGMSIHRTFFESDLFYFCRGFRACYTKFENLETLFVSAPVYSAERASAGEGSPKDMWDGISLFRETMAAANSSYSKHMSSPEAGSACKRLHLALRWLVRQEGPVDLGIWKNISPSSLFIPLDLHVGRAARKLGLLDSGRQANDKKAVISLTEKLRVFCPEDPVKYDLALFGYSVNE